MSKIKTFDIITLEELKEKLKTFTTVEETLQTTRKKLYFAAPWFDNLMNTLYDGCQTIAKSVQNKCIYDIFWPRDQPKNTPLNVFNNNIHNIEMSDVVIASISRKDSGTAFEIGMAKALNKPVYLLGYDESDLLSHTNVMLAFSGRFLTMDKFADFLAGTIKKEDFVTVPDTWEGKE